MLCRPEETGFLCVGGWVMEETLTALIVFGPSFIVIIAIILIVVIPSGIWDRWNR